MWRFVKQAVGSLMVSLWKRRERPLLLTHEPPFRGGRFAVGRLVDREGKLYRVTRWEEMRPLSLERGGLLREWTVWGRRVSDREVRGEIGGAAERMLEEDDSAEESRGADDRQSDD